MTTKNRLNVIREMTSLTNKFLQKGYQILEVHSDPNNGQNQAIIMSQDIVSPKGQDIIVVFKMTMSHIKEPFSRTLIVDNIVGTVATTKISDGARYWNEIHNPKAREITFYEQLEIKMK